MMNAETIAGRYVVRDRLHAGAVKTVYWVEDLRRPGTHGVLKRLRPEADEPATRALLENEFRLLSDLSHPAFVRPLDFFVSEEDGPILVLERAAGSPLSALAEVTPEAALEIAAHLLRALDALHGRGLLHYDVKPENVLAELRTDGRLLALKLLDFDLAGPPTADRRAKGTPGFVAPEVLAGTADPDVRSDLYGFGVTLHCLLTGLGPSAEGLESVFVDGSDADRALTDRYGSILRDLVRDATAADPEQRPASAREAFERLRDDPRLESRRWRTEDIVLAALGAPAFAGRSVEFHLLSDAVPMHGQPRVPGGRIGAPFVLVEGERGSGRTRLMRRFADENRLRGVETLWLDGAQTSRLDTPLRALEAALGRHGADGDGVDFARCAEAATRVFDSARSRTICLVIDDADQLDDEGRAFVSYFARRLAAEVLEAPAPPSLQMIVVSTAAAAAEGAIADLVADWDEANMATRLRLEPPRGADFTALAAAMLGGWETSEGFLEELDLRTHGNPASMRRTLQAALFADGRLRTDEPVLTARALNVVGEGVDAADDLHAGLTGLGGAEGRVVLAASLHPGSLSRAVAARLLGLPAARVAQEFERPLRNGLLARAPNGAIRIVDESTRARVVGRFSPAECRAVHDELAVAFREASDAATGWFAAYHAVSGEGSIAAAAECDRIDRELSARGRHEESLALLDAAAVDGARSAAGLASAAALRAAKAWIVRSRPDRAAAALDRLAPRAAEHSPAVLLLRARIAALRGDTQEFERAFEAGILAAGDRDPGAAAELYLCRARFRLSREDIRVAIPDLEAARARLEPVVALPPMEDPAQANIDQVRVQPIEASPCWDPLRSVWVRAAAEWARQSRRHGDALRLCLTSLKIEARRKNLHGLGHTLHAMGNVFVNAGRYDKAEIRYRKALIAFQRTGDLQAQANTLNGIGAVKIRQRQLNEAVTFFRQSLKLRREIDDRDGEVQGLTNLAKIYLIRSELSAAERALQTALRSARRHKIRKPFASILSLLGTVNEFRGKFAAALRFYRDASAADRKFGQTARMYTWEVNSAILYARTGQYARTLRLAIRALRESRRLEMREEMGHALLAIADVHVARGRPMSARKAVHDAHAVFEAKDREAERSEALVRLLAIEIAAGARDAAREVASRLAASKPSDPSDELAARRAAVELDYARFADDGALARGAVDAAIRALNQATQQREPYPAFLAAAALARHLEHGDELDRCFHYYTIALEQLEALVRAIADEKLVTTFMTTPEVGDFIRRARAFSERASPEASAARAALPGPVRSVLESIKRGFFDFEHDVGSTASHLRRSEEGIRRVLEISQTLSSTAPLDELLVRAVDGVIDFTGAERGFIVLADGKGRLQIPVARTMHREPIPRPDAQVSRKVIDTIIETRRPVLVHDALDNEDFRARESVISLELRAVMGAPMLRGERLLGVLYVDHRYRTKLFQEDDVQLLAIFANQVAGALETARLVREFVRDEKMRLMGLMASGVAHDFNNILASVRGHTELLVDRIDPELSKDHLSYILKAAIDGESFVKRLQDFTRVTKSADFRPVALRGIIDDVVEFTRIKWEGEASRAGRKIRVHNEVASDAVVNGNAAELREVFTNVVLNAISAMPSGGLVHVEGGAISGERVRIAVRDSGVGMSESVREGIFEPFFTTKDRKGSGLGMSIVYGIVMRHGGTVSVDSRLGFGTTIVVDLPRASEVAIAPESAPTPSPAKGSGQRVLVVDDDEGIRLLLRELLRRGGYDVLEAASGLEALQVFDQAAIDLVITDLGMAPMTGTEMATMLKARNSSIPVILLTGWAMELDTDEAPQQYIDAVIGKPFTNSDVLAAVASLLYRDER